MIEYSIILLAILLVAPAAYFRHFHGRPWREGIRRMLGRVPPLIGSQDDMGVKIGEVIELHTDACYLCLHGRVSHIPSDSHRFHSKEMRCIARIGRYDTCTCRHFTEHRGGGVGDLFADIAYLLSK